MATRTLADLVRGKLGAPTFTRENPEVTSVGVTPVTILRQNPNRIAWTFINLSTVDIWLRPLRDPTSSAGIRVGPSGGTAISLWEEDLDLVGLEWRAIADAAASAIFMIEWLLQREPGG